MNDQDFKTAIENNEGYDLFKNSYEELTPEQRDQAFDNAIKNNRVYDLLINCSNNLTTPEQREAVVENIG